MATPVRSTAPLPQAVVDPAPNPPSPPAWPRVAVKDSGLDPRAVETLVRRAKEADSDALVIVVDGHVVVQEDFGRERGPIEAMSATKSIVALAIGRLIHQGKIDSLDTPVFTFYPEWRQGRKQEITVRHLLEHTSGLLHHPRTDVEIYPSPDFVKLALAAELGADPGTKFSYNNKAVNLLAGIVEVASGTRMDRYIGREIFEPLGIKDFSWALDSAGNPHAMSGLQITALDLVRIGQLMLDEGRHQGEPIVSREFLAEALRPSKDRAFGGCGLLWWIETADRRIGITEALMQTWQEAGAAPTFLKRVRPLIGREFPAATPDFSTALREVLKTPQQLQLWTDNVTERGLPEVAVVNLGSVTAYRAEGYLGQHLVVVPGNRLIAVRQKRYPGDDSEVDSMMDFAELVQALAGSGPQSDGGAGAVPRRAG